ncbi:adenosylcobinamide amidohydrolase [Falsiporphyromonas endometrii]|uniref:Adenosylcobinamide amidohydrolase n=1 Tax=Falsiporphyromonas endometrii TaxID=1387297 RepID=A0ABV9K9F9_9PORP
MLLPDKTILDDSIRRDDYAMTFYFEAPHKTLSTCNLNGGIRRDLKAVFNHSCSNTYWVKHKEPANMDNFSILGYYSEIAQRIGVDPRFVTGLSTAARIENTSYSRLTLKTLTVEVFATAGLDVNAGRAGDPAAWNELDEQDLMPPAGTINLFIFINGNLDDGTMARALVMATEAKTSILQDLMVSGSYSEGLATGTGTDGVVIVCDENSPNRLTNAGKHSVLGEMIAKCVRQAIADALFNQSLLSPSRQCNIYYQQKRYGITPQSLLSILQTNHPEITSQQDIECFKKLIVQILKDHDLVAKVAALFQVVDENRNGLLPDTSLEKVASILLPTLLLSQKDELNIPKLCDFESHVDLPLSLKWKEPDLSLLAENRQDLFTFPEGRLLKLNKSRTAKYYEAVVCCVAEALTKNVFYMFKSI